MNSTPKASSRGRIDEYYRDLGTLMTILTRGNGFANLGWLSRGDRRGSFDDGQREMVRLVTGKLQPKSAGRLLEVGCGRGGPVRQTAMERDVTVVGLELLRRQIDAGKHLQGTEVGQSLFVQGSAEDMPFSDGSFDGVYCIESAFHYNDKGKFISEAARLLRLGGRLALADLLQIPNRKHGWLQNQMQRIVAAPEFYTLEQYQDAARLAGLTMVEETDVSEGVWRSLGKMVKVVFTLCRELRGARYSLTYLIGIIVIGKFAWLLGPACPVRYRLIVWEKPKAGI